MYGTECRVPVLLHCYIPAGIILLVFFTACTAVVLDTQLPGIYDTYVTLYRLEVLGRTFNLTASSIAFSQNGFIDIFTFFSSTPGQQHNNTYHEGRRQAHAVTRRGGVKERERCRMACRRNAGNARVLQVLLLALRDATQNNNINARSTIETVMNGNLRIVWISY